MIYLFIHLIPRSLYCISWGQCPGLFLTQWVLSSINICWVALNELDLIEPCNWGKGNLKMENFWWSKAHKTQLFRTTPLEIWSDFREKVSSFQKLSSLIIWIAEEKYPWLSQRSTVLWLWVQQSWGRKDFCLSEVHLKFSRSWRLVGSRWKLCWGLAPSSPDLVSFPYLPWLTLPGSLPSAAIAVIAVFSSLNVVVWSQDATRSWPFPRPAAPLSGKWCSHLDERERRGILFCLEDEQAAGLVPTQQGLGSQCQVTTGSHIQTGPSLSSAHPSCKQNRQLFGNTVFFHPASSFLP